MTENNVNLDTLADEMLNDGYIENESNQEEEVTENVEVVQDNTLEEIPQSLFFKENTSRFSSAIWASEMAKYKVFVFGVGGIGSWTSLLISRLNPFTLSLMDPDKIDLSNLSGQFYKKDDIDSYKVDSLRTSIIYYSDYYTINTFQCRLDENQFSRIKHYDVFICGFDNMLSRKDAFRIFKGVNRNNKDVEKNDKTILFIDGRLDAEELQIFCFTSDDEYYMKLYEEKYLFDESESEHTVCSYKQTSYLASMIGSLITNLYVNFCANRCNPLIERSLPFITEYNAETMFLKVES